MNAVLEAALAYAAQGLPVFPVGSDKAPRTRNGFKDATVDKRQLIEWWTKWPDAMIGMPTGLRTDIYCLDVDIKFENGRKYDGRPALKALDIDDVLAQCPQAITATGGLHYFFRLAGKKLKNAQADKNGISRLGKHVDGRGEGGYIVLAPSLRWPSKPPYSWLREIELSAAPLVPPIIEKRLTEKVDELITELEKLRNASPGARNNVLNSGAFKLAKLVLAGKLDETRCRDELTKAALEVGLESAEITKTLDSAFKGAREKEGEKKGGGAKQGRKIELPELEPWPDEVDGSELLDDLIKAIRRFVITSEEQALTTALWSLHAHCLDAATHSPRLHISSPVKRCGKTTLILVLKHLVPRPVSAENITLPAMFRIIAAVQPTLLIDEGDILLKSDDGSLRSLLNAGFDRGGQVIRCVGEELEVRIFPVWGAVVIAGIRYIPDTVADRSIKILLSRRLRNEAIERLDQTAKSELLALAQKCARWTKDHMAALKLARPELPSSIHDRAADCWEPLLAIAGRCGVAPDGEEWRHKAFKCAVRLSGDADSEAEDDWGITLLTDIRTVFRARENDDDGDRIGSGALALALADLDSRPWKQWGKTGKPITANTIARLLRPYRISPASIKFSDGSHVKGYRREWFTELWGRYCAEEGE